MSKKHYHLSSVCILVFSLDFLLNGCTSTEVDKYLELGHKLLVQGQIQDAISYFHKAVESDPNSYKAYYARATAYLGLGKSKSALPDLNKVMELTPEFMSARVQRGHVLLKLGRLDDAQKDYEIVMHADPSNAEAFELYSIIDPLRRDIDMALSYFEDHDYESAIILLSRVIERCPWDVKLRDMRADCYMALGDTLNAISDMRSATKLLSDNTAGFFKLSLLYYQLGEADDSLREIRECLKLDPDHKDCFPHYKKVKKLAKLIQDAQDAANENRYEDCISAALKAQKAEPHVPRMLFHAKDKLCYCYLKNNEPENSIANCNEALAINEETRILCDRAEAHIANEMFDEAVQDYRRAMEIDEHFQRAREGMQTVQRLQKQSKRRDYYKILGVRRTASKREILKAYRKLAQKWHPDNFQGESDAERKKAEQKFIDIAAAKEVLSDQEKRQKYDNGEDPLDPESGGQGFNPFQQFHNFQGSPFTFRFHFN